MYTPQLIIYHEIYCSFSASPVEEHRASLTMLLYVFQPAILPIDERSHQLRSGWLFNRYGLQPDGKRIDEPFGNGSPDSPSPKELAFNDKDWRKWMSLTTGALKDLSGKSGWLYR